GNASTPRRRLRLGAHAGEPRLRRHRRAHRDGRGRPARHRPRADRGTAAARDLQARPGRLAHHVRRDLLRRHVRRLHHRHPPQHSRRGRVGRHCPGGQQDGPRGTRRPGSRHRRRGLLRGRAGGDHRARLSLAAPRQGRGAVRPLGLLRPDAAGLRDRLGHLRRLAPQGPHEPRHRPLARPHRDRPAHRAGPPHLRHPAAPRRGGGHDPRRGPVRHRRDAVRRLPPPLRARDAHPRQGLPLDDARGLAPLLHALDPGHADRLPHRRPPRRRRRGPDLPQLQHRAQALPPPRGVRQRRHRGRRGPGGREQRLRRGHPRAAPDPGPAHLGHGGGDAGGVPAVQHSAGAAPLRAARRPRLGPDSEPVHRQRNAPRAEPAARRALGEAPQDPAALALSRHPGLRGDGHPRGQPVGGGAHPADRLRGDGLPDAAVRLPDRPGHRRPDPGPGRRQPAPPRPSDEPGRPDGPVPALELGPHDRPCGTRARPALRVQGPRPDGQGRGL
ncbi:MAG: Tripartite tricarboxylate transporter TctA family, partial [uncultured Rubellimicrobium sp.]